MKTQAVFIAAVGTLGLFAAHTDAPPGRYD